DGNLGGAKPRRLLQTRDQAAVFGNVVGGPADRLLAFSQDGGTVGRPHHRPIPGRAGITAGSAVRLDDDFHWSKPLTRSRIAPHSGQRSTSSSAAVAIRESSPRSISIRQAPHRRPCSGPAPGPP